MIARDTIYVHACQNHACHHVLYNDCLVNRLRPYPPTILNRISACFLLSSDSEFQCSAHLSPWKFMAAKRSCPPSVTVDFVMNLFIEFSDPDWIANVDKNEGRLLPFKFQPKKSRPELNTLYQTKDILYHAVKLNRSNIWKKTVIVAGLKQYDSDKIGKVMAKYGPATIFEDEAARLMLIFQELTYKKKGMSSGIRMDAWLKDIVMLIEGVDGDDDRESCVPMSPKKFAISSLGLSTPETAARKSVSGSGSSRGPLIRKKSWCSSDASPLTSPSRAATALYKEAESEVQFYTTVL